MFNEGRNSERESHKKKDKFVPLDEVRSDVVNVTLPLPAYVQNIGINIVALERMCRVAGIKTLRITGRMDDDISTTQNLFNGINRDGTANQVQAAVKTIVPEATSELLREDDERFHWRGASWADVRVEINTAEMANRIRGENTRRGVADSEAWAKHINRAIIDEIGKQGAQQLLRGGTVGNDLLTIFYTFVLGIPSGFDANPLGGLASGFQHSSIYNPHIPNNPHDIEWFIGSVIYWNAWNYVNYLTSIARHRDGKVRFSVLGPAAPELDRAAVLKAMESFRRKFPVIKAMSEKAKKSPNET